LGTPSRITDQKAHFYCFFWLFWRKVDPGSHPEKTAPAKRAKFEASRCKPMNVKNFDRERAHSFQPRRSSRRPGASHPATGRNIVAACLGIICVVGVFGVLGLLYSYGM
jgi:hypothetical protein